MNRSLFFIFLNENNNIINNDEWIYIHSIKSLSTSKDTICKWAGINIKSHPHASEQTPGNGYA